MDELTALLSQGGKLRVRIYADGAGVPGSKVLSIEPNVPRFNHYCGSVSPSDLLGAFLVGIVVGAIGWFLMIPVVAIIAGTMMSAGVCGEFESWIFPVWLGLTVLSGMISAFFIWAEAGGFPVSTTRDSEWEQTRKWLDEYKG